MTILKDNDIIELINNKLNINNILLLRQTFKNCIFKINNTYIRKIYYYEEQNIYINNMDNYMIELIIQEKIFRYVHKNQKLYNIIKKNIDFYNENIINRIKYLTIIKEKTNILYLYSFGYLTKFIKYLFINNKLFNLENINSCIYLLQIFRNIKNLTLKHSINLNINTIIIDVSIITNKQVNLYLSLMIEIFEYIKPNKIILKNPSNYLKINILQDIDLKNKNILFD